ncbi:MAG: response regulator transcription factor [Alphaproteobacteria bacterium]
MKVLVVDDNPKIRNMLNTLLDKEGFAVSNAGGGREGLAQYAAQKPDIICLDILMDDMSGIEVCAEIRKTDKAVAILIVTSRTGEADMVKAMGAGANDYITKPFDFADITARVKYLAKQITAFRDPGRAVESFAFNDVTVYPGQLRAERDGHSVDLSFREINFLRIFLTKRGVPVTIDELKPYSWAGHPSGEEKAVQWHISQLRAKIEADAETPALIVTQPDGSYLFK